MDIRTANNKDEMIEVLREETNIEANDRLESIANLLMQEKRDEDGQAELLLQSLKQNPNKIFTDLNLETVSWVENPSQNSLFVAMKEENNDINYVETVEIVKEEDDFNVVYGPALRAADIDKDGDVAPASVIREAAHKFLASGKTDAIDADHDLQTDEGELVESWILQEDKTYTTPSGKEETVERGSWMVGVKPSKEIKERIKSGEITGWSIFGSAESIELKKLKNSKDNNKGDTMTDEEKNQDQEETSMKEEAFKEELETIKEDLATLKEEINNEVSLEEAFKQLDPEEFDFNNLFGLLSDLMDVEASEVSDALSPLLNVESEETHDEEEDDEEMANEEDVASYDEKEGDDEEKTAKFKAEKSTDAELKGKKKISYAEAIMNK